MSCVTTKNEGRARIAELAGAIDYHNHCYWVKAKAMISDQAFDALVEELRALDPLHPVLSQLRTVKVGRKEV